MIPSDITFDANATPPQWTDNGEQVIEKGTNIRIKIKGLRSEVDKMYAVGTMKEVKLHALPAARVPHANHASRIILAHYHHRLSHGQPYIRVLSRGLWNEIHHVKEQCIFASRSKSSPGEQRLERWNTRLSKARLCGGVMVCLVVY
jgi:hypothetical protein